MSSVETLLCPAMSTTSIVVRPQPVATTLVVARERDRDRHVVPLVLPSKTTIHSLPSEILLDIFERLFDDLRIKCCDCDITVNEDGSPPVCARTRDSKHWCWRACHVLDPTLFPYAPATACRRWRDILASIPAFWTRIVICVDSPGPALTLAKNCLQWSRDELVHIWITRRKKRLPSQNSVSHEKDKEKDKLSGNMVGECERERRAVEGIMRRLAPHLHRCRSIHLNLLYRSSIMAAARSLKGSAPFLQSLVLNSAVTDTEQTLHADGLRHLECPLLNLLVLDAKTLVDMGRSAPQWLAERQSRINVELTQYAPSHGGGLRMSDVIRSLHLISSIHRLRIRDVAFCDAAGDTLKQVTWPLHVRELHLEGLRGSAVSDFFAMADDHFLFTTITRCQLRGPWHYLLEGYELRFVGIDDTPGLVDALDAWEGRVLSFERCANLGKTVLHAMAQGRIEMVNLEILRIGDCPFSTEDLKRVVRQSWHTDPIRCLQVRSPGVPISTEDYSWFSSCLNAFDWSSAPMAPISPSEGSAACSGSGDAQHEEGVDPVDLYGDEHMLPAYAFE
ncbi:hypothetical protein CONPUDRAFT_164535 [Coniophora puteana RWD-64-598 SS2]|uniref:F-box domain-containing protein n=1 Tax=Coniophora puteana (strain RWD-64-598) TaxID=741705 RepID=A0A5M3MRH4_CONPW|nr:uncharacterized protein CONPUDRAFT_164535 [Coniophora puteana RWD-64-598 SS2]EIW81752.1 hypothetical protein CONPUDRAFT_164535 [Coniophora puteana RWD-64-598 SS2]